MRKPYAVSEDRSHALSSKAVPKQELIVYLLLEWKESELLRWLANLIDVFDSNINLRPVRSCLGVVNGLVDRLEIVVVPGQPRQLDAELVVEGLVWITLLEVELHGLEEDLLHRVDVLQLLKHSGFLLYAHKVVKDWRLLHAEVVRDGHVKVVGQ